MELVGDVAGGEDARGAGLQAPVDEDAVVDREARLRGELACEACADADDDGRRSRSCGRRRCGRARPCRRPRTPRRRRRAASRRRGRAWMSR